MRRVPDEGSRMPPVRGEDEEERQDERGQDAVEVHFLRREHGAQDRRLGQAARVLPRLAAHQGAAGRHAGRRAGLQAEVDTVNIKTANRATVSCTPALLLFRLPRHPAFAASG